MTDTGRAMCDTCQHWAKGKGNHAEWEREHGKTVDSGQCRRTPPAVSYDQVVQMPYAYWPETSADQWCGEHEKEQATA